MDSAERRVAPRVSVLSSIEMVTTIGDEVSVTALDLSETGISIWASGEKPSGPVRLRLPLDDGMDPLEVDGSVAREFQSDGGSVWGIVFDGLTDPQRVRLRLFVEKQG